MEALCRITLLEPYRGDPTAIVALRDGQRSLVPMGASNASIADPSMHVGFNSAQTGEPDANRFKAAENVIYELRFGDNGIIIPVSCAQFHFGDWTVLPGDRSQAKTKRTYQQERTRVAMAWGDWTRMPRGKKTNNGVAADTRCIGLPSVPHVKIEVLEQNGSPYGPAFDPWAFFKWESEIDRGAVQEAELIARENGMWAPQVVAPAFDLSSLSEESLEKLAALLAARGGNGGGSRGKSQGA